MSDGHVGGALGERRAHEQEPLAVAHHRLVGEVDEGLGAQRAQHAAHAVEHLVRGRRPRLHGVEPRHPDLGGAARPSPPASPPRSFSRPPAKIPPATAYASSQPRHCGRDHGWVVFAVDEHDGARPAGAYLLSSWGTGQMYLSNAAVDGTKSISVSSPWNGYLRATCTLSSSMRTRL